MKIQFARFARSRVGIVASLAFLAVAATRASAYYPEHTNVVPVPALDPGFPVNTAGAGFSINPEFVDIELDGRFEVLAIDNAGIVHIIGQNGVEAGGWPKALGGPASGAPAVGDIDGDGIPEIVTLTQAGLVQAWSTTGLQKMGKALAGSAPVGGPVLAEMDTTGRLAVVVATQDGTLHAILPTGAEAPGFPVATGHPASGGAFTFIGSDNFPRIGLLTNPGGAQVYFTYGLKDTANSFDPGVRLGPAEPVSGERTGIQLLDQDNVYLSGHLGQWWRLNPDVTGMGGTATAMTGVAGDSVLDTPCMVDVTGDMQPELAFRSLRADTLSVWIVDGATGAPRTGFPKRYLGNAPGGGIVAADLGDGATPEIVFNQGGTKVTCLKSDGTSPWTLTGLLTTTAPALGDLDGDGALDMAVATTDGKIAVYTLGTGGVGPKGVEWPNQDGWQDRARRHHPRDRAELRPWWPAPFTPQSAFMARPEFADLTNDAQVEVLWADELSTRMWAWGPGTGAVPGFPQQLGTGTVTDAPAVGDVTGDGVVEAVEATSTGSLVWADRLGHTGTMVVDAAHALTAPALADLDGDGTLDAIVGSASGRLYAVNLVSKTVIAGWPVTCAGAITQPVSLGDVTGDNKADVIAVSGGRVLNAFARTGGAQLTGWPRSFPVNSSITQPILVPVAGDAGLAVAFGVSCTDSAAVNVDLVGPTGAKLPGWPLRLIGTAVFGPVAGDFSNDGVPDFGFSTDTDTMYVFLANGGRAFTQFYSSPSLVQVCAMVDVDLDQRPELIAVSDQSVIVGMRFNGSTVRSFDRLTYGIEFGQPPAFGDMQNDGTLDMAVTDLGTPNLFQFGFESYNRTYAPWPMKYHDAKHTNAFSGLTVVGVAQLPSLAALGADWARALPNPSVSSIALTHSRALTGRYEASIFDLRGRLVRRIAHGDAAALGATPPIWTWNGLDETGHSAPAGVYFYRVVDARGALSTRIVRMR